MFHGLCVHRDYGFVTDAGFFGSINVFLLGVLLPLGNRSLVSLILLVRFDDSYRRVSSYTICLFEPFVTEVTVLFRPVKIVSVVVEQQCAATCWRLQRSYRQTFDRWKCSEAVKVLIHSLSNGVDRLVVTFLRCRVSVIC